MRAYLILCAAGGVASADEVIVVSGTRTPAATGDVPADVTVIDREAIERSPAPLADDLLRVDPSLATFRRSSSLVADPTAQGLALRGLGPSGVSRALVLADGVPQNDPFGGWVYWRAISMLAVDRVEVVPGGASSLFGNFGLGGVVQLFSRPIEDDRVEAVIAGGSLRSGRAAARATARIGGFGIALDGEAFHSNGYTPVAPAQRGAADHDAASDHGSAGARVERALGGGARASAFGRWFRESLDAGTGHTTADVSTIAYGAAVRTNDLDAAVFGSAQVFRQERARLAPGRASAASASHQRTPSSSQGGSVAYRAALGARHQVLAGADAMRVEGTATDALTPAMPGPDSLATRAAGGEQRFGGVFAQDLVRVSARVSLSAAVRLDAWQDTGGHQDLVTASGARTATAFADRTELQLDPRVGAVAHVTDELALRGSVYRAFRAPTLNELYRPFQVGTVLTDANAALGPESVWGAELGAQVDAGPLAARATGFWNRLEHPIDNVTLDAPLADGATRQRQNLGRARVAGLELGLDVHPSARWSAGVAYTFAHAVVTDAPAQPMLVGKHLAQDPAHRATAWVTFDDPAIATVSAQLRYASLQFEDDQNALVMGAYVVCSALVARRLGHGLAAFVAIDNVFDSRYVVGRAGVDTLGAPRTIEIGLRFAGGRS